MPIVETRPGRPGFFYAHGFRHWLVILCRFCVVFLRLFTHQHEFYHLCMGSMLGWLWLSTGFSWFNLLLIWLKSYAFFALTLLAPADMIFLSGRHP